MRPLVGRDLVFVLERQTDVVEPIQQAVATERFDLDRVTDAVRVGQRARFQIGRELIVRISDRSEE